MSLLLAALLLPGLAAFGASGFLRTEGAAAAGVAFGLLAGFVGLTGAMPFLGHPAQAAVGEGALIGLVLALALSRVPLGKRFSGLLALGLGAVAAAWPAGLLRLVELGPMEMVAALGEAVLGALVVRQLDTRQGAPTVPPALAIAAAALAAIAFLAKAGLAAWLALALAAAMLGLLAWRAFGRLTADPVLPLVAGSLLVLVAAAVARSALHAPWAILILPLCFWPERVAGLWPAKGKAKGKGRRRGKPASSGLIATAAPALLAVGLALLLAQIHGLG